MTRWKHFETPEERAKTNAFWESFDDNALRELALPEEDKIASHRGGTYRRFRSSNVIDLVRVRKGNR
jgi:hypothetical protein